MALVRLTQEIADKKKLSLQNIRDGIDAGKIKGQKLSDRIWMIDESEIPGEKPELEPLARETDPQTGEQKMTPVEQAQAEYDLEVIKQKTKLLKEGFPDLDAFLTQKTELENREADLKQREELLQADLEKVANDSLRNKNVETQLRARIAEWKAEDLKRKHQFRHFEDSLIGLAIKLYNVAPELCEENWRRETCGYLEGVLAGCGIKPTFDPETCEFLPPVQTNLLGTNGDRES